MACSDCGHRFTDPIPSEEMLSGYYESDGFADLQGVADASEYKRTTAEMQWRLIKKFCETGLLVDVGPGAGTFLSLAPEYGFSGVGLEKCGDLAEMASTKEGVEIHHCSLEDDDLPVSDADVVTMWDVFEHLQDPGMTLRRVQELLKPGGLLCLGLPNARSLSAKIFRGHWIGWWVPLHLHHYSLPVVRSLLEGHQFRIVHTEFVEQGYAAATSVRRLFGLDTGEMGAFVCRPKVFTGAIRYVSRILKPFASWLERFMIRVLFALTRRRWGRRYSSHFILVARLKQDFGRYPESQDQQG